MKTKRLLTIISALAVGAVGLSGIAVAQGQGGGGGGGTPEPPDYGDLIVLLRNESGVPILDENQCQQPIAFLENIGCPAPDPNDPPTHEWIASQGVYVIPTDPATCGILPSFATCAEETDFGRTNLARANDRVLESQLEDVIVNLAISDCTSVDPTGRMVYSRYIGDQLVTGTIDSPLQNLAVYKYLMRYGDIGVPLPQGTEALVQAARSFGVAVDKSGETTKDQIAYINEFLGLTSGSTILGAEPVCIYPREEVMGVVQPVEKCFLDFTDFTYDRFANFGALPSPEYIPSTSPDPGTFEYMEYIGGGLMELKTGDIYATVFGAPEPESDSMRGFAAAVDDTRAVIEFIHSHAVPDEIATPVPCTPIPDPTLQYDLSISDKSGLKVPKQIVATTEGREFVVTVANAGPDTAAGTLTVTAVRADGGEVLLNGVTPGPFVYSIEGLAVGMSFTTGVQVFTLGPPYDPTMITWTANVVADSEDPVPSNNTVVKYSNVKASKGGSH